MQNSFESRTDAAINNPTSLFTACDETIDWRRRAFLACCLFRGFCALLAEADKLFASWTAFIDLLMSVTVIPCQDYTEILPFNLNVMYSS